MGLVTTKLGSTDRLINKIGNVSSRVIVQAAVGSIISRLTGGKFANGAFSAGFARTLGELRTANSNVSTGAGGGKSDATGAKYALAKLKADKEINTMKYFDTAKDILNLVSPISKAFNIEIGGSIIQDKLGFRYTTLQLGDAVSINLTYGYDGYHTHPNGYAMFSNRITSITGGNGDVGWLNQPANRNVTLYLGAVVGNKVFIGSCTAATCFIYPLGTQANKVLQ